MTDYTLYYWPIPFRGHFVRYALARAGATWDEPGMEALAQLKNLPPADQPTPFMGPPVLVDHGTGQALSQMPAIVMHLGRAHGLIGDADLALRLLCDANDVLFEITRGHGAQMWDRGSWATFRDQRLGRWLAMHDHLAQDLLQGLDPTHPGLEALTLTALWHTMADHLPALRPQLTACAPGLMTLVDQVAATPALARMRAPWQGTGYCGGQIEASLLDMLNKDPTDEHI